MTETALRFDAPFAPGGEAGIDPAICQRLLGICLAHGGEYADLFFEHRRSGSFVFDDGILKSASRGTTMGLGVRVQRGEATGFAYVEDLGWEAAKRAAEKRSLLERASAAAMHHDPRIVRAEAGMVETMRQILIATSDGVLCSDVQPMIRFSVRAVAERDGRRPEGSSGGGGRTSMAYFERHGPEFHGRRAAERAVAMLDAEDAPAGQMPVVLAPGDSGILLHEAVGHGLEADFNHKGTSRYSGQIGTKVASELCTVVDDATLLQARGSLNVDDEGVEPGRTVLIDRGRLCGYMHDRLSARHFGLRSTGNGRRESFACSALPRMTNTILLAGTQQPDEILSSVKRGVYAARFGGGQVDISNGDFVFSLTESYLIEDGKLTRPLKDVNLIGNGPEVLTKVSMLGTDLELSDGIWTCGKQGQSVPVGVGCPTVKIDEITVGGTKLG
jgi:TldD protein